MQKRRASARLSPDAAWPTPMITFATLINDDGQFARCRASLGESAQDARWIQVRPNSLGWNAAQGLNYALERAETPWVVCTHQDVRFPRGWRDHILRELAAVPADVAIVGIVGNLAGGDVRGHILDPNGHCYWGPLPARVLILDEVVMILRREANLRFDEDLPGFHLYGADLCLQANSRSLGALVVDAPVRHLSTGTIDNEFRAAQEWLLSKWGNSFGYVLPTPAVVLVDPLKRRLLRWALLRWRRRRDYFNRNDHDRSGSVEWPEP